MPVPLTPQEAYEQSRLEMEAYAQAQREAAIRARQQQQQQSPISSLPSTVVGHQAMDAVMGSGATEAAAAESLPAAGELAATAGQNAAYNSGANAATAAANMGATPIYVPAAAAVTTALAGKSALNMINGTQDNSTAGKFGRGSLAIASGGISEGINKGLDAFGLKHKSTKDYEKERWGALANTDIGADTAGKFFNAAHADGDTGENWTPEVEAQAMSDPQSMAGQLGLLQTFGNDYFTKMGEFERFAAARAAIDEGLLDGDHGDILVTDPERLKAVLPKYVADEKVQQEYNAYKAKQAAEAPTPQGSGAQDMDAALSASLAGVNAQARADARKSKLQGLMIQAAQPRDIPNLSSGPIRTGVSSLDDVLGGVLR